MAPQAGRIVSAAYFERTASLGFGTQQDYERNLNDPK
jgi:hypothetical protein